MKQWKKILSISTLAVMLGMMSVSAAPIKGLGETKLGPMINLQQGDFKSLLAEAANYDIKAWLENYGVLSPEVYQIRYKSEEDYRYATLVTGSLGVTAYQRIFGINASYEETQDIEKLGNFINYQWPIESLTVRVISPLKETNRKQVQYGELGLSFVGKAIAYNERVHFYLYKDRYYGASFMAIITKATDDAVLWPLLEPLSKKIK